MVPNLLLAMSLVTKLTLTPGETKTVPFPEGTDIAVSRRGVVDLHHAGGGVWQITGLRAGLVAIAAKGSNEGERVIVSVSAPHDAAGEKGPEASIPAWLCAPRGVVCNDEAGLVSGTVESPDWFLHARRTCNEVEGCSFHARLSPDGRRQWRERASASLGSTYAVEVSASDVLVIEGPCEKDQKHDADKLLHGAITSGDALVRCKPAVARYRLAARIYLVEEDAAKRLGFDAETNVGATTKPWLAEASLATRLEALAASRHASILGEPVVYLAAHAPVKIASGGEFQVVDHATPHSPEPRASWKQHGLAMQLTAAPRDDGRVRLAYELSLKGRAATSESALSLNAVSSSVDVALGEAQAAALLDLSSEDARTRETPVLASIPLIGPLFTSRGDAKARSRLVVWLCLTAEDPS